MNWRIGQELEYRSGTGVWDRKWSIGQEGEYRIATEE